MARVVFSFVSFFSGPPHANPWSLLPKHTPTSLPLLVYVVVFPLALGEQSLSAVSGLAWTQAEDIRVSFLFSCALTGLTLMALGVAKVRHAAFLCARAGLFL